MKKRRRPGNSLIIILLLAVTLCTMGVAYAAWSGALKIDALLSTGSMSAAFDADRSFEVFLAEMGSDGEVREAGGYNTVRASLGADGKSVSLTLDSTLIGDWLSNPGRYLAIVYPVKFESGSTVDTVLVKEADFENACDEVLSADPADIRLLHDGGSVPLGEWNKINPEPLLLEVYRSVEYVGEKIIATVYLGIDPASAKGALSAIKLDAEISDLPEEILDLIQFAEDGSAVLEGSVITEYVISVPIYLDQGRAG